MNEITYPTLEKVLSEAADLPSGEVIPSPYVPEFPWRQPLHKQPKGRLHKSKEHMVPFELIPQAFCKEGEPVAEKIHKTDFRRNGFKESIVLVRFKTQKTT